MDQVVLVLVQGSWGLLATSEANRGKKELAQKRANCEIHVLGIIERRCEIEDEEG